MHLQYLYPQNGKYIIFQAGKGNLQLCKTTTSCKQTYKQKD